MKQAYYLLHEIPDLSLSKYSSLDESGVEGVITHHATFWRQMHRRGLLSGDSFHLFYEYNPSRPAGKKLQIGLRFDTVQEEGELSFVEETVKASPLSSFYQLLQTDPYREENGQGLDVRRVYPYHAHLMKKEIFSKPLRQLDDTLYYTTSEWGMNEGARLYTMTKLMEAIDRPCVYCVSVYPCDMTQVMEQNLTNILPQLRQATRAQINARQGSVGLREKDENANAALDFYEDLLESLGETPHFLVDVQVLSDDARHASYILDAAASEALEKGAHDLCCFSGGVSLESIQGETFISCASEQAPQVLRDLPHLFLLEQLVPFGMLPALYPGEWIEMKKETAPPATMSGLLLGENLEGHQVFFPLKNLSKHAFLAGVPGSGKTNSMMHLIASMHREYQIPVLVLEPAKHEYRALTGVKGMEDLELFSPGASTRFPLHINPFEFPKGMTLAEHIRNLIAVFDGAFALEPPMPFLLDSSVEEVYKDHNWVPAMINAGQLTYPTMSELYQKLEDKLEKTDYAPEIQGNLKSALQVRIGSLLTREMGDIFDVPRSTVSPENWLKRSAVIELEALGKDPANFMTLLVATLIRETLKIENYVKEEDGRPRHVMFFEEAHNLIGSTAEPKGAGEADPKTAATAYIVKMLAEVRALGEGIVIADQLPTAMAPEVIKNTSLKIALRITAQDDRELLGGTMNANGDQLEKLSIFSPGHALISYEPLLKPFEVQIPYFEAKEGEQEDEVILQAVLPHGYYFHNIMESLQISSEKWDRKLKELKRLEVQVVQTLKEMTQLADQKKQAVTEDYAKMRDLRKKLYQKLSPLLEGADNLAIAVAAYKAPFQCLLDSDYIKTDAEMLKFRKMLMLQLARAVKYQREVHDKILTYGLPINKSRQEHYIKRKDILLHQGAVFENL